MNIRIVVADDHPVVRQGIRMLLDGEPGLEVVGDAADGLDAMRAIESTRPDVLVTDLMMPNMGGLELARRLRERRSRTTVVIFSFFGDQTYVAGAASAGAIGYVLKEAPAEELIEGVRAAARGRQFVCKSLSDRGLDMSAAGMSGTTQEALGALNAREREVLQMVAEGCTSARIAEALFLSRRTVEAYRASMQQKLGLKSQAEVARYALAQGVIPPLA